MTGPVVVAAPPPRPDRCGVDEVVVVLGVCAPELLRSASHERTPTAPITTTPTPMMSGIDPAFFFSSGRAAASAAAASLVARIGALRTIVVSAATFWPIDTA